MKHGESTSNNRWYRVLFFVVAFVGGALGLWLYHSYSTSTYLTAIKPAGNESPAEQELESILPDDEYLDSGPAMLDDQNPVHPVLSLGLGEDVNSDPEESLGSKTIGKKSYRLTE